MSSSASNPTLNWLDPNQRATFVESEARKALSVCADNRGDVRDAIAEDAYKTDSPIEAQFAAWFNAARGHELALGRARFAIQLHPQFWLETNGRRYRLDFAIEPLDEWLRGALLAESLTLKIGVELDGHAFHEKTKEQVTARNQRDRDLSAARWTVLHFSGSELHYNPMIAVVEVLSAGADALDQAKSALFHG